MDRWHIGYSELMDLPLSVMQDMLLVMEAEGKVAKETAAEQRRPAQPQSGG